VSDKKETQGNYFAVATHELRSPLNSILGFASLLLEEETDEKKSEKLKIIRDSSKYLLNLINDILDLSKIEVGKLKIIKMNFLLISSLRHIENLFSIQAKDKNITFIIEIDKSVPNVVLGDELRINQVLINLLSNAFKFTDVGGTVKLKCFYNSGVITFIISDSGIGISDDKLDKIFLPFEQADSTVVKKYGGTGLGLTITKKIVTLMDGEIKVESKVGEGTSFSIIIPIAVIEINKPEILEPAENVKELDGEEIVNKWLSKMGTTEKLRNVILSGIRKLPERLNTLKESIEKDKITDIKFTAHQIKGFTGSYGMDEIYKHLIEIDNEANNENYDIQKIRTNYTAVEEILSCIPKKYLFEEIKKEENLVADKTNILKNILIAEDSKENQELLKAYLQDIKINYEFADNGQEVLVKLENNNFDVLFLDMQMPVMDGRTALRKIKEFEKYNNLYIIAFTADDESEIKEQLLSSGCNDFLSKPVDKNVFIDKIMSFLS
jgi:two-component system, NarL family, sensor histidine kinase BarA